MPAASPTAADAVAGPAVLVAEAALEHPDKLALVESGGRSLTWAELDDEVGRVATGLAAAGIVAGYRVVVMTGNRLEFVTTYLGILRAQAVAVPLNPGSTAREVARVVADCGARMVVADGDSGHHGARGRRGWSTTRSPAASSTLAQDVPAEVLEPAGQAAGRRGRHDPAAGGALLRPPARRHRPARPAAAATPSGSPPCSTPAVRRACRAPRCSATARWPPTSRRSPRSTRR